jgi:hypothetical protein
MMIYWPCSLAQRERHLRIAAGVPDSAHVDLSLVKLPTGALKFPNPPAQAESFSFTKLRNPRNTTKEFVRKASALGFGGLRLHDLRGAHETILFDMGVPVHVVAARCGHDPAVLLPEPRTRTALGCEGRPGHILKIRAEALVPSVRQNEFCAPFAASHFGKQRTPRRVVARGS